MQITEHNNSSSKCNCSSFLNKKGWEFKDFIWKDAVFTLSCLMTSLRFWKTLSRKFVCLKKKIKKCLTGSFLFLICLVNVFFPLPFCTTVTLCKFVLACVQCLHMKYMIKPSVDNHIHKDRVEKLFSFSVDNHLSSFICMWLNIKQWTVFFVIVLL